MKKKKKTRIVFRIHPKEIREIERKLTMYYNKYKDKFFNDKRIRTFGDIIDTLIENTPENTFIEKPSDKIYGEKTEVAYYVFKENRDKINKIKKNLDKNYNIKISQGDIIRGLLDSVLITIE